MKKIVIDADDLRLIIIKGISTEELNEKYDYSEVTDMSYMFSGCTSLETVPILNLKNVTDTQMMFCSCLSIKTIEFTDDKNLLMTMHNMFFNCKKLQTVSSFNYINSPIASGGLFANCISLENIDVYHFSHWDFTKSNAPKLKEKYPELYI
jgi:hypothetical protein